MVYFPPIINKFSLSLLLILKVSFLSKFPAPLISLVIMKVDSSIENLLFFCLYPKICILALALYLDFYCNNDIPDIIHPQENFYLIDVWYPTFAKNEIFFNYHYYFQLPKITHKKNSNDCSLNMFLYIIKLTSKTISNMLSSNSPAIYCP